MTARISDKKLVKILGETERMTPTGHYLLPGSTVHSMASELKELRARNKCDCGCVACGVCNDS